MASIINASTAGAGGVITTADASGVLNIQSGGTTIAAVSGSGVVVTGSLSATTMTIPSGTTLTSPVTSGTPTGVGVLTNGTVVTASGTSVDFTGIPSWAKRITVIFNEVSTNGTADLLVQLGDSGGIENTGYISTYIVLSTGGSSTAGFIIRAGAAAVVASGILQINLIDTTSWICTHTIKVSTTNASAGAGSKSLSGILDRVRVTTTNGTDAFDAGSINILYE